MTTEKLREQQQKGVEEQAESPHPLLPLDGGRCGTPWPMAHASCPSTPSGTAVTRADSFGFPSWFP